MLFHNHSFGMLNHLVKYKTLTQMQHDWYEQAELVKQKHHKNNLMSEAIHETKREILCKCQLSNTQKSFALVSSLM